MEELKLGLAAHLDNLRRNLALQSPESIARRLGISFEARSGSEELTHKLLGTFSLFYWGQPVEIQYPEFVAFILPERKPLGVVEQALLAYYLTLSNGAPPVHQWISFSDLPDGRFYSRAFQSYTGDPLYKTFGETHLVFTRAAITCGGKPIALGDTAFLFPALPHLSAVVVAWLGDEDYPGNYQVLFDANASHHLTTDGCAILGGLLVGRLIKAHAQTKA
jgi:hypothetical protein